MTGESIRILNLLRKKPEKIVSAANLDRVPELLLSKDPVPPLSHRKATENGSASVEIIISRRGTVELAKVVGATSPEYGYAAIQAMSEWQFEPPRQKGKVVDAKIVAPLIFKSSGSSE